jgi:hypothetical protein
MGLNYGALPGIPNTRSGDVKGPSKSCEVLVSCLGIREYMCLGQKKPMYDPHPVAFTLSMHDMEL